MSRWQWIRAIVAVGVFALLLAAPAWAEIYRWVDASGREHFAMDLDRVPPEYRAAAIGRAKASEKRFNVVTPPAGVSPPARAEGSTSLDRRREDQAKPGGYGKNWWRRKYLRNAELLESAREWLEYQQDVSVSSRAKKQAVADAVKNLRRSEKRMRDFQEEARRAGAPPGWVR